MCVCVHMLSSRVANILTGACGLSPGDHVIVLLPKIPQWWLLNIACARAGITAIIIYYDYYFLPANCDTYLATPIVVERY